MGAFRTTSRWIAGHLGELVGYKAGLALTREEIAEHLVDAPGIRDAVLATEDRSLRLRSDVYAEAVSELLYQVGNIPIANPLPPVSAVFHRFADEPTYSKVLQKVITRCTELLKDETGNLDQGRHSIRARSLRLSILNSDLRA